MTMPAKLLLLLMPNIYVCVRQSALREDAPQFAINNTHTHTHEQLTSLSHMFRVAFFFFFSPIICNLLSMCVFVRDLFANANLYYIDTTDSPMKRDR